MHTRKSTGLFEQNSLPRISHELVFSNSATLAHLRPERLNNTQVIPGENWTTGISCPSYNIWMPTRFSHDIITKELKKGINLKLLHKISLYWELNSVYLGYMDSALRIENLGNQLSQVLLYIALTRGVWFDLEHRLTLLVQTEITWHYFSFAAVDRENMITLEMHLV